MLMSSMAVMSSYAQSGRKGTASVIEKTPIEVVDGKFTPEIMLRLGRVSDPQLSPDGSKILYGVTYTSIEENRSVRQLYVMNADGSGNHQITHFPSSANNARWYGDGSVILYLQGGQIWSMSAEGKNIRQVSNIPGGISEFKLSPDQTKVMYIAQVQSATRPTDLYPDLDKSTGREIDGLMYRHWDCFVETIPHTFVADVVRSGKSLKVAPGKDIIEGTKFELPTLPFGGLEQLSWSPDGQWIAYACRKLTGKDYAFSTNTDIYLYNVADGSCENLSEGMNGYDTDPVFSPDGKSIAWLSMERAGFEADRNRVFVIDLASREKRELTVGFDHSAASPVWKADGSGIYFNALAFGLQAIFSVDLQGNVTRITPDDLWYDFGKVAELGEGRLLSTAQSMSRPDEIVSDPWLTDHYSPLPRERRHLRPARTGKMRNEVDTHHRRPRNAYLGHLSRRLRSRQGISHNAFLHRRSPAVQQPELVYQVEFQADGR